MAKSPHEAMAYVQQSLTGEASIADRLQCVQRLRVVALALGEEKTRTELLPFLRKLRDPPVRPCPRWRSRALRRSPASEKYAGSAPLFLGVAAPPRSGAATSCTAVPPVGLLEPTLLIFPARARARHHLSRVSDLRSEWSPPLLDPTLAAAGRDRRRGSHQHRRGA